MVSWIQKWGGVGLGVMGEQRAEAFMPNSEVRYRNQRNDSIEQLNMSEKASQGI